MEMNRTKNPQSEKMTTTIRIQNNVMEEKKVYGYVGYETWKK